MSDLAFHTYLLLYSSLITQSKIVDVETCVPHATCIVGCFIYVFLSCSSMGWNFVIGIDLVLMLKNPFNRRSSVTKYSYHLAIFFSSLLMAVISILDPSKIRFVEDKNTCFISDESSLMRLTTTFPMLLCTMVNIPILIYVSKTLRKGLTSRGSQVNRMQIVLRFWIYTLATTMLWIVPLVGQLIPMFLPEVQYKMFSQQRNRFNKAKSYFEHGQSLVDIIVYGTHPGILMLLFKCVKYQGVKDKVLSDDFSDAKNQDRELESQTELADKTGSYSPPTLISKMIAPGSGIDITLRRDVVMGLMYCMNYVLRPSSKLWSIENLASFEPSHFNRMDKLYIQKPESDSSKKHRYVRVFTADQPIRYYIYAPEVFKRLREHFCDGDQNLLRSFPYPLPEDAFADQFSEGKSGSFFSKTVDEKYIIKSVSKAEAKVLLNILPNYLEYMTRNNDTFISRIYGLYSIKLYQGFKMIFLVMSNIFPPKKSLPIHSRFDIKGSWVNRSNAAHKQEAETNQINTFNDIIQMVDDESTSITVETECEDEVKIDSELGLDMDIRDPLYISSDNCEFVREQLQMDSKFLASCSIMDYSLLIGIHKCTRKTPRTSTVSGKQLFSGCLGFWSVEEHEIYFIGIIDILQLFNLSKKAEKIWKHVVLRKDKDGISSQPPEFYSIRFQEKIVSIFQ